MASNSDSEDMDEVFVDPSSSPMSGDAANPSQNESVSSYHTAVDRSGTSIERSPSHQQVGRNETIPPGTDPEAALPEGWQKDRDFHDSLFSGKGNGTQAGAQNAHFEEIKTTPLLSANVLLATLRARTGGGVAEMFPSYGLLAERQQTYGYDTHISIGDGGKESAEQDHRLFLNTNAPWSAFICGSQGSGKSHTLSCILEDALLPDLGLGKLPNKLAGIVFHYDKFIGVSSSQICEAAYLCSKGIQVNVLVSPSSFWPMRKLYENLPGLEPGMKPNVAPLLLEPMQLNVERMMKLMAMEDKEGGMPLYMQVVCMILRQMAIKNKGAPGLDYKDFMRRLSYEDFNQGQLAMVNLRLQLLETFMKPEDKQGAPNPPQKKPKQTNTAEGKKAQRDWNNEQDRAQKAEIAKPDMWKFPPGSLTIIDLSCPFVDESFACTLFNMCLSIFLENRQGVGRIVALDEAHKFMSEDVNSSTLTDTLLSVIRQQRHLATRVVIATQEPTISPKLLDLSSMTIVHRFTSPSWLDTLKAHLAGASHMDEDAERNVREIFRTIVTLQAGQALLFSPSAMMDAEVSVDASGNRSLKAHKLGMGYIKIGVRKRLTADGGRSIMAT